MPSFRHLRPEQYGKISHLLRATNGFAGLYPARKRKRGVFVLGRRFRSLKVECGDPAVGLVVPIVDNIYFLDTITIKRGISARLLFSIRPALPTDSLSLVHSSISSITNPASFSIFE